MLAATHLNAMPVAGITSKSPWATVRSLFRSWQYNDKDIRIVIIFSFSGLAISLFVIERFPSFVATISAFP